MEQHSGKNGVEGLYGVSPEAVYQLNEGQNLQALNDLGGTDELAKHLKTNLHDGLDPTCTVGPESISMHKEVFGPNTFHEVPPKSFLSLVVENMKDPIIILLIAAATVSTLLGASIESQREEKAWIEGVAIWVAVFVVAFVGAGNDWQKDQQFRKLNAQKEIYDVTVVRGSKECLIKNIDLVVGDVLILNTGDKVTGDGLLFENHDLVLDESALTGESEPYHSQKELREDDFLSASIPEKLCFSAKVSEGSGKILVIAVGENSEWGKTLSLVSVEGDETPLQEKLGQLASAIGKIGFAVALLSFIVLCIRWMVKEKGFKLSKINQGGPIEFFLFAVTIVVVAVPEGLPLAVTISLAYSMKKMMKDNNFVRVLAACETMGGATAICSDKTGTLTENRMTVVEGWFHGLKYATAPGGDKLLAVVRDALVDNIALNSKAFLIEDDPNNIGFVGNRTECALLMLAKNWGVDYTSVRAENEDNIVKVFGFSSAKKMASVLVRKKGADGDVLRLYNKGAAEIVLDSCSHYFDDHANMQTMTKEVKQGLLTTIEDMASRGLRTLALTYTDFSHDHFFIPDDVPQGVTSNPNGRPLIESPDENLVIMGIVGIKDPVRKEVPDAVESCKTAGITVRMVTGDNIHTAQHIARECGILTSTGLAMEGPDFRRLPEEELRMLLPQLQVLARSSPTDKHTLVHALREMGEVVAVTGDGTNDAPALKESDVGLAMGIAGTEVAKEAADIVILDDNFSSIVKAVLWGRAVFNNIRKFLQFQLTINMVALLLAFIAAVAGGELPLNVLQLLWVNLIMDTMAALALATEMPTPDLLHYKPHGRNESLISGTMWKHIFLIGLYQLVWLLLMLYGLAHLDEEKYGEPKKGHVYFQLCSEAEEYGGVSRKDLCSEIFDCADGSCTHVGNETQTQPAKDFYDVAKHEYDEKTEEAFQHKASVIFNAFIFMQIFNELNARKIHDQYNILAGITESTIFGAVLFTTVGLQILIMQTPLNFFFKVYPLSWQEWMYTVLIGFGVIPISSLIRFVSRSCAKPSHAQQSHPDSAEPSRAEV